MKHYYIILILSCLLIANACGEFKLEGDYTYADSMVTKTDAEEIFGEPMRLHSLRKNAAESFCYYTDAADDYRSNLEAKFQTFPDAESLEAADEIMKEFTARGGEVETVHGIGDAAWLKRSAGEQAIYVRKNKVAFIITFSGDVSKGSGLEGIKSVSRRVASRL